MKYIALPINKVEGRFKLKLESIFYQKLMLQAVETIEIQMQGLRNSKEDVPMEACGASIECSMHIRQ